MSTIDGSFGSRNVYRSVLSAVGSWLIRGASRCDDAPAGDEPSDRTPSPANVTATKAPSNFLLVTVGTSPSMVLHRWYATAARSGCASVRYADDAPVVADGRDDHLERRRRRVHGDDARPLQRVVGVLRDELRGRRPALQPLDRTDLHGSLRATQLARSGAQAVELVDPLG